MRNYSSLAALRAMFQGCFAVTDFNRRPRQVRAQADELGCPFVFADGRYVALHSRSSLAGEPNTDGYEADIYRIDVATRAIRQVSVSTTGQDGLPVLANNAFGGPSSATGRLVSFSSGSRALVSPDHSIGAGHGYMTDLDTGVSVRVSSHHGGTEPFQMADRHSNGGPISSDGSHGVHDQPGPPARGHQCGRRDVYRLQLR